MRILRVAILTLAVGSLPRSARAEEAQPCDDVEVDYTFAANLELADTPMGQGNGTHRIGPGFARVRFSKDGSAQLVAYGTTERLVVEAHALFWKTTVKSDSRTTVGADACGVVATGRLEGSTLEWTTDLHGVRTDGTLTCDGSLCGSFGAPPPGRSPLHVPPHDVHFYPWTFSPDGKTFTMPRTWVSHTESPSQTAFITLAGRETKRTCVKPAPRCAQSEKSLVR
ncbi:MAG TPA: hypothetical protein VIF62_11960 [Labilithrix sp.]